MPIGGRPPSAFVMQARRTGTCQARFVIIQFAIG